MADPADLSGLIHHPYRPPEGFDAPQPGVHKASTVYFPNVAALRARDWREKAGYTYGLHGTPTTYLLEERIAHLEGGLQCVLVPSGLSAISTTGLALLQTGDEVLIPDNAYGPNKALAEGEVRHFGISHHAAFGWAEARRGDDFHLEKAGFVQLFPHEMDGRR